MVGHLRRSMGIQPFHQRMDLGGRPMGQRPGVYGALGRLPQETIQARERMPSAGPTPSSHEFRRRTPHNSIEERAGMYAGSLSRKQAPFAAPVFDDSAWQPGDIAESDARLPM